MYQRPSNAPDEQTRRKRPSLLMWLVPLVLMVAVLSGLAVMEKERPAYHGRSCRDESVLPHAHTIVVIDQTNALSDPELVYVKEVIRSEYQRLNEQERLTVMGLRAANGAQASESGPSLFFTTCRVPRGDEVSSIDNNPAMVEARFEALVGQSLAALINSLKAVPEAQWSPIIETLENVSDDPMFSSSSIARRLVLISDMMQNTKEHSQYPRIARKASAKPSAAQFMRAFLIGVDVRVHYIFRDGMDAIQSPDHEAFWKRYFAAAGARTVQIGWGMSPQGRDQIEPIVWNAIPPPPAPPASVSMAPSETSRPDVPPLPEGTLAAGEIVVHGTRHAARGGVPAHINYEIDWQRFEDSDALVFDVRRVLLLTSHQNDRKCYVSVPLVTKMARHPDGGQWGPGRLTRRLETYEQSEQNFVQRLALEVGIAFESATCEIVGARLINRTNTGPRYRALRCIGADFTDIEEQDWDRFTQVTTPGGAAARLAVISGRHQLPPADLKRIGQRLEDQSACPAQPMFAPKDQLLLGLQWFDEPAEPSLSNVGPVVSGLF